MFFIVAFSSAEAKDVSNSLCSYKGGNKTENFRSPFFQKKNKRKGEVIKLIMCCVLKNTLRQVDAKRKETKLDVRGEFYFFCTFRCGALRGWRRSKLLSVGNA